MRIIDADAALEKIWEQGCEHPKAYPLTHYAELIVREAPTIEAEPIRHGRWIFDFELDGSNFYKCSVCGRQEVLLAKESTDEYFPYCHCGAKMDGGKTDV